MGKNFASVVLIAVLSLAVAQFAAAGAPTAMTVQGKLTNSAGNPVAPGAKSFTFKIYDAQAGGTDVWPAGAGETQPVTTDANGLWTAQLGALVPLTSSVFAGTERWLEVTVNDGVNPPETLPRIKLNTNPYSFRTSTEEPGVASNDRHAELILTGGIDVLTSRSLTAPSDGYILAIATGEVYIVHTNAVNSLGLFGLADSPAAIVTVQNQTQMPGAAPTGTYKIALAAATILTVSAGTHTIYLLGQEVTGNLRVNDLELSLLFVPTAYGTVDPPAISSGNEYDGNTIPGSAAAPVQIESISNSTIQQELEALRAQLNALKAQVEAERNPATDAAGDE
ncbi:MAG: hypothetical protein HZB43_12660 [candidate division Zixibacteria bacterium]|nr:hypothetical protein [candidate division Zixibacteria bacterium]